MSVHLLLVPVLLYSLTATAADEPHPVPERWGDLAPEYGDGECDERRQRSGASSSMALPSDSAREREPNPPSLSPSDAIPERAYDER